MHEEIFNIFIHKGNANQNDIEIPSHLGQKGKEQQQILVRMGKGEGILLHCETVKQCSQYGK
jgi:hypothetical protein